MGIATSHPQTVTPSSTAFVGRQPILDRKLNVHGYELLFRDSHQSNMAAIVDGERATSQVIANTFIELGLESIVGPHQAFLNFTRPFLLDPCPLPLPTGRVVLELLEDIVIDDALVTAVTELRDQGYVIALDDFVYSPDWDPLIELATIIKLDVGDLGVQRTHEHLTLLQARGKKLLAEKVETREQFQTYKEMGFDYFQGYFYARPEIVSGKRLPTNKLSSIQLLASLNNPATDMRDLEKLISRDMGLSYRLLRYINSAAFSVGRKVESIRQAIVLLGLDPLRRWASLVVMTANNDKPVALLQSFLVRARLCELLAEANGDNERDMFFTAGLFSGLDALVDRPLAEVIESLPLSQQLAAAITDHIGPAGEAVACALAFERCRPGISYAALPEATIHGCYTSASAWSFKLSEELKA